MEISVKKRRGKKFALRKFYSIPQTCYVSGKGVVLALTRRFPDFLPRCGNLLQFQRERPLSKKIFAVVQLRRVSFSENFLISALKRPFGKIKRAEGAEVETPAPLFLRGHPVHESGRSLLLTHT